MQLYYQTDVSFMTAFLLLLISIIAHFRLNQKDTVSKAYLITAWIIIFVLIVEAYTIIIDGKNDAFTVSLSMVLNTLLFLVGPIITLLWFYLIRSMFAPTFKKNSLRHVFIFLPQLLNIILVLSNPWTKFIFSIENGLYTRQSGYLLVTISIYFYVLMSVGTVVQNWKTISKQNLIILMVSTALPIFGGIIQAAYYGILTIWPSVGCALILLYLFLQQRVIHLDHLTHAWTRETFFLHINRLFKQRNTEPADVLYFDLNDLKAINDNYGHHAGDIALKTVVSIVKEELPSDAIVARLGGDEFIAFMSVKHSIDMKVYVTSIKAKLDAINQEKTLEFPLSLAFGYGRFFGSYDQFDKFMNQLDKDMYIDKRNMKKSF
ncbi:GGDEF domain-containing protein [Acholeplasma vituli]|uniref:GGDEF domain-containing protein n=1 Tax=Paracholeplasma vituli TaxID=69473 RepID=A0ABT2Q0S0_9MOLU|nr:GGDEF domain-containing protein [Paracholeplasma vituli]MCU0105547.1 GGDEF domain-containing protein [Paracholeplasma vituli]